MRGKSKKSIVVLIVLLAIGFAAVTTTLTINGTIRLGAGADNFRKNLVFTKAVLSYSDSTKTADEGDVSIIDEGRGIQFTTKTLTAIGESVTLTYQITNRSQYIADLEEIKCTVKNAESVDVTNKVVDTKTGDYIKLEADSVAGTLQKQGVTEDKNVKITMIKSYVGTASSNDTTYSVTCTIDANGRTE